MTANKEANKEVSSIIKYHDNPIESADEDILGRDKFSKHLAGAILNWGEKLKPDEKKSLVIGINAEWGSGKSSVINMVEEELQKRGAGKAELQKQAPSKNDSNVVIIKFNPWAFSAGNNLGPIFFTEISKQLEKEDAKLFAKTAHFFRDYAAIIATTIPSVASLSSSLSPEVTTTFSALAILAISADKVIKQYGEKHKESEKDTRELLRDELIKQGKKIVVVIDDIDRLTITEIKQILRLVRVNGDFPNMIYLLAFDRLVVENLLAKDKETRGKDYLDKIVQVSFNLPAIDSLQVSKLLTNELDELIKTLPGSSQKYFNSMSDDIHWSNMYDGHFNAIFKNLRDVKRFINGLNFNIKQMYDKDEMKVNPVDFITIEVIRLFAPSLYDFIHRKRYNFTHRNDIDDGFKNSFDKEIKKLPNDMQKHFETLLGRLFPHIKNIERRVIINKEKIEQWDQDKRICSGKYFYNYFILADKKLKFDSEELVKVFGEGDDFWKIKNNVRGIMHERRIPDLVISLDAMIGSDDEHAKIIEANKNGIIRTLFNIPDDVAESLESHIHNSIANILLKLMSKEDDAKETIRAIESSLTNTSSLFIPYILIMAIIRYTDKKPYNIGPKNIRSACIQLVKRIGIDKLLDITIAQDILYSIASWGRQGYFHEKKFEKEIMADNTRLFKVLNLFHIDEPNEDEYMNIQALNYLVNIDKIKKHLDKLKTNNTELSVRDNEIIKLFMQKYDRVKENRR